MDFNDLIDRRAWSSNYDFARSRVRFQKGGGEIYLRGGGYYAFHLRERERDVIIARRPMEDLEGCHPPFNKSLWQLSGDQQYTLSGLHSSSTKYMQVGIK